MRLAGYPCVRAPGLPIWGPRPCPDAPHMFKAVCTSFTYSVPWVSGLEDSGGTQITSEILTLQ